MRVILPVTLATALFIASTPNASFAAPVAGSTLLNVTVEELRAVAMGWSIRHDVLGRLVYNEKNESIGRIEDVVVAPNKTASFAIIDAHRYSVVSHDVAVPVSALEERNGRFVLPHLTQADLKAMPPFEYAR